MNEEFNISVGHKDERLSDTIMKLKKKEEIIKENENDWEISNV